MKKLFYFLFSLCLLTTFTASAQSTRPRFGTTKNSDNTARVLTYNYVSITDAEGADSTTLFPSAWNTTVRVALTDSFYLKSPTVTKSYAGDNITIIASGTSGKKLKFAGTNFITAGTATLSSSGRAVVTLVFDGAKWVESARVVQ